MYVQSVERVLVAENPIRPRASNRDLNSSPIAIMNFIKRIRLEDGPEDGLELTPALLKKLVGGDDRMGEEISLFMEPGGSSRRARPFLLGRYCLVEVTDGTARYRWSPA